MESQGYMVNDNIVYQDNKSSILLEKDGKASSGKCTKHMNIRYFFITDQICNNKASVVWCPTGDMIADFATKSLLQGALFKKWEWSRHKTPGQENERLRQWTPSRYPGLVKIRKVW
jgi:hypothetical protein